MMEMANSIIDVLAKAMETLAKDPIIGFLCILIFTNIYTFSLYLKTNDKYIRVLIDNVNITGKMNAIMGRLKINSGMSDTFVIKESTNDERIQDRKE